MQLFHDENSFLIQYPIEPGVKMAVFDGLNLFPAKYASFDLIPQYPRVEIAFVTKCAYQVNE